MVDEIENKVASSGIEQVDLIQFKDNSDWKIIDLKDQLWNGLVLKEKEFRLWVKEHDWANYQGEKVCVYCSTDAIIPSWAFMLVTAELKDAAVVYCGGERAARDQEFFNNINAWNVNHLKDKRVMVKGCSNIPEPNRAYVEFTKKLQPIVKSLMFGEPCSAVPVYKRK